MDKSPEAFKTITEAAEILELPQHVLRFWETRFSEIKPLKRGGGRRYYKPQDIDLLRGIKQLLYSEGYSIRGLQRIFREKGAKYVIAHVQGDERHPDRDYHEHGPGRISKTTSKTNRDRTLHEERQHGEVAKRADSMNVDGFQHHGALPSESSTTHAPNASSVKLTQPDYLNTPGVGPGHGGSYRVSLENGETNPTLGWNKPEFENQSGRGRSESFVRSESASDRDIEPRLSSPFLKSAVLPDQREDTPSFHRQNAEPTPHYKSPLEEAGGSDRHLDFEWQKQEKQSNAPNSTRDLFDGSIHDDEYHVRHPQFPTLRSATDPDRSGIKPDDDSLDLRALLRNHPQSKESTKDTPRDHHESSHKQFSSFYPVQNKSGIESSEDKFGRTEISEVKAQEAQMPKRLPSNEQITPAESQRRDYYDVARQNNSPNSHSSNSTHTPLRDRSVPSHQHLNGLGFQQMRDLKATLSDLLEARERLLSISEPIKMLKKSS